MRGGRRPPPPAARPTPAPSHSAARLVGGQDPDDPIFKLPLLVTLGLTFTWYAPAAAFGRRGPRRSLPASGSASGLRGPGPGRHLRGH